MKHLKKFLAVGLVVAVAAGLGACGGGEGGGGSAEDIMKTAQEALAKVNSMSYEMSMDMNMSAGGQTMESSTKGTIDCIADPLAMKMAMTVDAGAQGKVDMLMYAEQEGENFVMYMSADNGTNWGKQTVGDAAALEQYNGQESMELYLSNIESFKEAGTEQVNGKDAIKYEGVIANDALNEVMAASGVDKSLTSMGITEEAAAGIYADLGDLPVTVWLDKDSSLPVKYEMDMTEMMQNLMNKVAESMGASAEEVGLTVDKVLLTMTMTNFDSVETIEIPEAAKSAQEMNLGI